MFRKRTSPTPSPTSQATAPIERITSVLGASTVWKGHLGGSGGVRIEGSFEGEIALSGLLVIGETGRVTCQTLRANTIIVAGIVRGDILARKVEIRRTGRVWGNVRTVSFATEEGAFLRGQIIMEEQIDLGLEPEASAEPSPEELQPFTDENNLRASS